VCTAAYRVGGVAGARTALVADARELLVRGDGRCGRHSALHSFVSRRGPLPCGTPSRSRRRARAGTPQMPPRGDVRTRAGSRAAGCRVGASQASDGCFVTRGRTPAGLTRRRRAGLPRAQVQLYGVAKHTSAELLSRRLLVCLVVLRPELSASQRELLAVRPPAHALPERITPAACARRRRARGIAAADADLRTATAAATGYATQLAAERAARAAPGRGRRARHPAAGVPQPGARALARMCLGCAI
jgi:hypothetical protein